MYIIKPVEALIRADRSDNIVIVCEFNTEARPEPLVTWLFNNSPIRLSDNRKYSGNRNVLSIRDVDPADSGEYTCVLSNGYQHEQKFAYKLEVHG
jgi:hypothetical protein